MRDLPVCSVGGCYMLAELTDSLGAHFCHDHANEADQHNMALPYGEELGGPGNPPQEIYDTKERKPL